MAQDSDITKDIKTLHDLNLCLVMREADAALRIFCDLLNYGNLKVSPELLAKIPVKPAPETQG